MPSVKRSLALALVHLLVALPVLATGPPGASSRRDEVTLPELLVPPTTALTGLDRAMGQIEALRGAVDRSQFDLEALLDQLELDPQKVLGFVTEEIAFEPYQGLLRGARGTLMSRAGNALDQAVLLATLLRDSGYDARIALGTLEDRDAERLVRQVAPPPGALVVGDRDEISRLRRLITEALFGDPPPGVSMASAALPPAGDPEIEKQIEELVGELRRAGRELSARPVEQELRLEARDYAWVEHRLGPADPWKPAHPAFGRLDPPPTPTRLRTLGEEVPEELQHRIRIEVVIERQEGRARSTLPVMSAWERPAANLHGVRLTYANLPNGFRGLEDLGSASDLLAKSSLFTPLLNGELAPGARVFDLAGTLIPPDALQLGAAGVFEQVQEKVGTATSALGALGRAGAESEAPPLALLAQRLVVTHIAPGGAESVVQRTILDRESGLLDAEQTKRQLFGTRGLMITTGDLPPAYLMYQRAGAVLDAANGMRGLLYQDAGDDTLIAAARSFEGLETAELLTLMAGFDHAARPRNAPTARLFRAEPGMVMLAQTLAPESEEIRATIDILSNARRALRIADGVLTTGPLLALQAGVWETEVERLVAAELFGGGLEPTLDTRSLVGRAGQAGAGLVVLDPASTSSLSRIDLGPRAEELIASDLAAGYLVVAPERRAGPGEVGWWRIHPVTGETLGMIGTEGGAAVTSYLALLGGVLLLFGLAVTAVDLGKCLHFSHEFLDARDFRRAAYCCFMAACVGLGLRGRLGKLLAAVGIAIEFLDVELIDDFGKSPHHPVPYCRPFEGRR